MILDCSRGCIVGCLTCEPVRVCPGACPFFFPSFPGASSCCTETDEQVIARQDEEQKRIAGFYLLVEDEDEGKDTSSGSR